MEYLDDNDDGILWNVFPLEKMTSFNRDGHQNKKQVTSTLLFGPSHSYKTTLLFQAAVTYCERYQSGVLFVTQKPMSDLPRPVHGMPRPTKTNMTHLQFVYVDESTEFMKFLTSFHEIDRLNTTNVNPTLICVDGLDCYVEQREECLNDDNGKYLTKMLALLQDVAYFCSLKGKNWCRLFVTCAKMELCTTSLNILKHFFDHIWNLQGTRTDESERRDHGSNASTTTEQFLLKRIIGRPTTLIDSVTFQRKSEEIYMLSLKQRNK